MKFQYFLKIQDIRKRLHWLPTFDFYMQTAILAAGLGLALSGLEEQGWFMWSILMLMIVIGCWQMISSVLSFIFPGPAHGQKLKHLLSSLLCIFSILLVWGMAVTSVEFGPHSKLVQTVMTVYFFAAPWTLAIYYYVITWRLAYPRHKKLSSFLPHINF